MAVKFLNTGNFPDNVKLTFGNDSDIEIYSAGNTAHIEMPTLDNFIIGDGSEFLNPNISIARIGTQTGFRNMEETWFGVYTDADTGASYITNSGTTVLESTNTGVKVTGTLTVTGDVLDRDIPCWIGSNFLDGTSSVIYVVPFNNNNESTVSTKTYYHYATMPYAGQLKRVTFKNVSGTPSTSSFTVQLFLYVNGSQQLQSSEISWSNTNGITWSPTSSNTFSAGDEITIGYQKSTSSRTMAGVAAGIVVEFTDYDI